MNVWHYGCNLSSADELVADAVYGGDVGFRILRGNFLAQGLNLVIDRSSGRHFVVTPDVLEKPLARDDVAAMANQQFEDLELFGGQTNGPALARGFHSFKI